MAGRERKLTVILAGDAKGLQRAVGQADRSLGGFGSKLGGLAKTAAIGFGAVAAGAAVIGKGLVDAATESAKVTAQTNAVLKSMGDVAGVTAEQVAGLSEKLSLKSGVDDEVIQSAQNVLLTFGKVRNELGKGNKVFDRATAAALDMSVALGTDMQGATIQIGKALNDPIKGITALSRAGVSFTEDQKKQIKTLVESGKTLDAQKIILSELEKQFGGSAAAQATAADKLKVAWGNVQEQLGEKLLPVVEKVATFLAKNLPSAMKALGRVFGPVAGQVRAFFLAFQHADDGVSQMSGFGRAVEETAIKARRAFDAISEKVREWWPKIVAGFQAVAGWVQTNWPKIQQIIGNVMRTVSTIVAGAVTIIETLWQNFGNNILEFVQRVWPPIQQVISGALEVIRGVVQTVTSLIKGDWANVWNGIKGIVSGVWQVIQGVVKTALEALRGVVGIGLEVLGSMFKSAWKGIVDFFKGIPGALASAGAGMFDWIWEAFKGAINLVIRGWNRLEFKIPGFDPPGPGPKFGGFTLGVPDITPLAAGGIVTKPTLALIGEGRHDEAVIPLDRAGGFGTTIIVEVNGGTFLGTDQRQLKRELVGILNKAKDQGTI